jgi:hypothetical protein
MTKPKGTARVLLPTGAVDADYDDAETPIAYDDKLADELLDASRRYQQEHRELAPGRPSLSEQGRHSPHVSFRVPVELAERLDEQSAAEGISRSAVARRALSAYLTATRRASSGTGPR